MTTKQLAENLSVSLAIIRETLMRKIADARHAAVQFPTMQTQYQHVIHELTTQLLVSDTVLRDVPKTRRFVREKAAALYRQHAAAAKQRAAERRAA
ncbi:MAG: hypothetical protein EBS68_10525 [Rhodobacteraceae bacterium]|nr:hypothetical protein [Paracoccaceae bacterium]